MIGCERLCGRCEECKPLVAMVGDEEGLAEDMRRHLARRYKKAASALTDPERLADLLARALRGRSVSADTTYADEYPDVLMVPEGDVITFDWIGVTAGSMWTLTEGRAFLFRLLALPLDCGVDAAIAALEE